MSVTRRDPATEHHLRWLRANPRLDGIALDVAVAFQRLSEDITDILADGPELTAGLRLLRQAKDCCVIQALADCEHPREPQE